MGFFPKGLVHGFGPKMGFFPPFYFRQSGEEKRLCRYSRKKNAFVDYKNKKQKIRKIALFPKGSVHSFGQQMGFFPPFYFWQKRQEKSLWPHSRKKKRLSRL